MKFKNILKYIKERQENNQQEIDRDLNFYESDFFYFLKFIFMNGKVNEETIMKKRRLSKLKFDDFVNLANSNEYIKSNLASKSKSEILYEITPKGVDYILKFKRSQEEKSYTKVVMWATIILGISATVDMIDLLLNKPDTRNFIIKKIVEMIGGILSVLEQLIKLAIVIGICWFIIWIIIKLYKNYKKSKEKKK